jgi:hypothetical protein
VSGLLYASLKYFALGLVVGLLTAPRPGGESRRILWERVQSQFSDLFSSLGAEGRGREERRRPPVDRATGSVIEG